MATDPVTRRVQPLDYTLETEEVSAPAMKRDPLKESGLYNSSIAKSEKKPLPNPTLPPKLEKPEQVEFVEASLLLALNEVRKLQDYLSQDQSKIDIQAYRDLSLSCKEKMKLYLKKVEESQTKEKTSTFLKWLSTAFFGVMAVGSIATLVTGNPGLLLILLNASAAVGSGATQIGKGVVDQQLDGLNADLLGVTEHRAKNHQKMEEISDQMKRSHEISLSFLKILRETLEAEIQTLQLIKGV